MPDATVKAASTGEIPKAKSAADMTLEEMRAQLKLVNLEEYPVETRTNHPDGNSRISHFIFSPADSKGNQVVLGWPGNQVLTQPIQISREIANRYLKKSSICTHSFINLTTHSTCYNSVEEGEAAVSLTDPQKPALIFRGILDKLDDPRLKTNGGFLLDMPGINPDRIPEFICDRNDGKNVEMWNQGRKKGSVYHADCSTFQTIPEGTRVESFGDVCGVSGGSVKCFYYHEGYQRSFYTESNPFYYDRENTAETMLGLS